MHFVEAKGILSSLNGMNIYRGCTHGCIYCDSRSKCYNMQHDFEDIEVKINAPELLEKAIKSKRKPCMIGTGSMSDPYMHIEEKLQNTRKCLEIIERYEFGVAVQTKSDRVLRDLDLLKSINEKSKAVVQITLTTADDELCKLIEPNVCPTSRRAEVLEILKENGIPTVVWMSPILPFINDTEENIGKLMEICKSAKVKGIITFGMGVSLRDGNREYFYQKIDEHFPGIKERYIKTYGNAYELESPNSKALHEIFFRECEKSNIMSNADDCFKYLHEYPEKYEQLSLF